MAKRTVYRVGISGWRYGPWRGTFYPEGLAQRRELELASRKLNSIEINGSFYSLQRPSTYERWHDEAPEDFVFAVKGGRFITHMRRLKEVEQPLANFFASGVLRLGEKLGPILWQLPPNFVFEDDRLAAFLDLLPRTVEDAAKLAKKHDRWMRGRVWTEAMGKGRMRHAMEVRHESFENARFIKLLRRHKVALVVADTAGKWPYMEDMTADFVYIRLHGDKEIYVSGYTDRALERWADRIKLWSAGKEPADRKVVDSARPKAQRRDVYVYFDNDVKVRAPFDAMALAARLEGRAAARRAKFEVKEEARRHWPGMGHGRKRARSKAPARKKTAKS